MYVPKILVCLDLISDEQALIRRACEVARQRQAQLTALHVVPEEAAPHAPSVEDLTAKVRERLESAVDELPLVEIAVVVGYPLSVILEQAASHELVMTGADHNRRIGDLLFGGTTTRLLRSCPKPMLVVRSDHHQAGTVILAAIALRNVQDDPHDPLDREILREAVSHAQLAGAALHVVHVAETWVPYSRIDGEMEAQEEAGRRAARTKMDALLQEFGLPINEQRIHMLEGDPAQQLAEVARTLGADLVVMGTVGRTGIAGLIVGNTAETLMKTLDCSLLALKPEGFVAE